MPTYVYQCTECEHQFEVIGKMSDRPRTRKCPVCGGRAQRQISGGAGFLFKGEGFYITDYRSEEYRSKAKADSDAPAAAPAEKTKSEGGKPAEKEPAAGDAPGKKERPKSRAGRPPRGDKE